MWNKYSDVIFFLGAVAAQWFLYQAYIGIKARAFNEGYKRGRSSALYAREILK